MRASEKSNVLIICACGLGFIYGVDGQQSPMTLPSTVRGGRVVDV